MTNFTTPHEINDKVKLQGMIDTLNNGGQLPAVVVIGEQAITGSHRLVAWYRCEMRPEVVELSESDYIAAMELIGLDPVYDSIYDYDQFCEALYKITDDTEIKAAIKDQRG